MSGELMNIYYCGNCGTVRVVSSGKGNEATKPLPNTDRQDNLQCPACKVGRTSIPFADLMQGLRLPVTTVWKHGHDLKGI